MTTIRLHIPETNERPCAVFEFAGDVEYLRDLVPYIASFVQNAVAFAQSANRIAIGKDLSAGLEAMNASSDYQGEFVQVNFEGGQAS